MKITDVRMMKLIGPRRHAMGGEEGRMGKIIIRVDADNDLYGLGEADNFLGVKDAIDHIRTCLVGRDPFNVRPLVSEILYGSLPPHPAEQRQRAQETTAPLGGSIALGSSPTATPTGPIIWAISGVEMALCDLVGKALSTPVYNLLGGKYRDKARVYLDRSSPKEIENLNAWKQMASDAMNDGFCFMKFDVDYTAADLTEDYWNRSLSSAQIARIVERIGVVRKTVGPDVEISVDCHRLYNAPDAIRLTNALAPLNLFWFEDPTPEADLDACAEVRHRSPIPICVGEMFTPDQLRIFVDHAACDIVHPDVMFCGGLHEAIRIADFAELHCLPMAMHGNGGSLATVAAAHVAAATRNFLGLEFHHIETEWIVEMVKREGVALFADGGVPLTDAPGLGVELNYDVCRQHLAPGQSIL